ncbi:hypothetical protein ACO0QE_000917 [Hanseniaspora vineae]
MATKIPTFALKTGAHIPVIGFGAGTKWRIAKSDGTIDFIQQLADQVSLAVKSGYTMIDCAEAYKTHEEVGCGLRDAGITDENRNNVWITDKYTPWSWEWRKGTGPVESCTLALEKMKLKYVDLYLLHMPQIDIESAGITLEQAWEQCEQLCEKGLAKNIGVSNFTVPDLERIYKICKIKPVINQIEFHAYLQQQAPGLRSYCKQKEIQLQAYSPLTPILKGAPGPLDPVLERLSTKYGKSFMQILLKWVIQNDIVVLTTSGKQERIKESLEIFDFNLTDEEVQEITDVGRKKFFRSWEYPWVKDFGEKECYADL